MSAESTAEQQRVPWVESFVVSTHDTRIGYAETFHVEAKRGAETVAALAFNRKTGLQLMIALATRGELAGVFNDADAGTRTAIKQLAALP
jgi:hypothetical protein